MPLTKEKEVRLEELRNQTLTEYQKQCVEINDQKFTFELRRRNEEEELMEARIEVVREDSHEAEEAQREQDKDARVISLKGYG